jgi:hypothetical protein
MLTKEELDNKLAELRVAKEQRSTHYFDTITGATVKDYPELRMSQGEPVASYSDYYLTVTYRGKELSAGELTEYSNGRVTLCADSRIKAHDKGGQAYRELLLASGIESWNVDYLGTIFVLVEGEV